VPTRGNWTLPFPATRSICLLFFVFPWPVTVQAQAAGALIPRADNLHMGGPHVADVPLADLQFSDLAGMVGQSALIFVGKVQSIVCEGVGKPVIPRTYRVTFRVQRGIKGAATGETVSVREWSGLWAAVGRPRFRVGEQTLVFFYAPSGSGVTSTVGGSNGKLEVRGGEVTLPGEWAHAWPRQGAATGGSVVPDRMSVAWMVQQVALAAESARAGRSR